jgi:hypothetical protein
VTATEDIAQADRTLTDEDLPELFRAADRASRSGQRRFLQAVVARLLLLLFATLMALFTLRGVVDWLPADVDMAGLLAAVAFMAAILVEIYVLRGELDTVWYEGRAAAESAKSLAWRYAVGGEPFAIAKGKAQTPVDEAFLRALYTTLQDLGEVPLQPSIDGGRQITEAMRELRAMPLPARQAAYLAGRIEDQRHWYATKQRWNARRAGRWAGVTLLAELSGILAAVFQATGRFSGHEVIDHLAHVFAPLAVAAASWMQTKQFRTLASSYGVAAQELATIASLVMAQSGEARWAVFVEQSETAISREHRLWRATRGRRKQHPEVTTSL